MKLLLDTHIFWWYVEGYNLNKDLFSLIEAHRELGSLFVSNISFWEISLLLAKGRVSTSFGYDIWLDIVKKIPGMNFVDTSPKIFMRSSFLQSFEEKDPADRIIVATAREYDMHILTLDRKILNYAAEGYVSAVEESVA